jgi:cytochrome c biogenesis protein CcmG/thiol:disulfide interchange protein DsbE
MSREVTAPENRPRSRRVLWIAVSVAVVAGLLVAVLATRPPAATRAVNSPLLGKPAPPIEGDTLDGGRFSLTEMRGRWVLVNFFATWCVPCRQEHDDLVRFHRQHAAAGDAEVVGVIYDDSLGAVRTFRDEEGGAWPMVADPRGRTALDYGVSGVPESFLVSPEGTVAAKIVGGVTFAGLEDLLARAAAARQVPE